MPSLYRGLARVLRSSATERPLLAWVKRNPLVLSHAIGGTPLPNRVVAEFPFGTDFRADFVAAGSYSGGWYISFVEFEPSGQSLFTKSGAAAKRLNGAIAQVD